MERAPSLCEQKDNNEIGRRYRSLPVTISISTVTLTAALLVGECSPCLGTALNPLNPKIKI